MDIPEKLIEDHDVTVDYIVTPSEIIKCNRTKGKPTGIIWSKLEPNKVKHEHCKSRAGMIMLTKQYDTYCNTDLGYAVVSNAICCDITQKISKNIK